MTTLQKWLIAAGVIVSLAVVGSVGGVLATQNGGSNTTTHTSSGGSSSSGYDPNHWSSYDEQQAIDTFTSDGTFTHSQAECILGVIEDEYDTPREFAHASPSQKDRATRLEYDTCIS